MKTLRFKIKTFVIAVVIFCVSTFITLIAAGAVDEGTEGTGILGFMALILSKLFHLFRFPTHTFFFDFMNGPRFLIGLLINCIFYAFLTERLIFFLKKRAGKIKNLKH